MERTTSNLKFLAAIYTIGGLVLLLDILIWMMVGVMPIGVVGGIEFVLVVTGTIMAFNKKTRVSKNWKKIIWFYSIMIAQAVIAIVGLTIFAIAFGTRSAPKVVGTLIYVIFAARAALIASAAILIIKLDAKNEYENCPRIHILARALVASAGCIGVISRCIYTVTRESLEEIPFTIISWFCIGAIVAGIILGYVLKVKNEESKFV